MKRTLALASLAVAGLALYLWPAASAPVVLWSDSEVDLRWAGGGVGLWKTLTPADAKELHPLKPGFLLFLRGAANVVPGVAPERSIVLVQSLLLWAGITFSAILVGRRRGIVCGMTSYVCLVLFLPIRNSASVVMSEAISAALLLPLAALSLSRPNGRKTPVAAALPLVLLFWIRPNVAAVALLLIITGWSLRKAFREAAATLVVFLIVVVTLSIVSRSHGSNDFVRGLPIILHFGSAEYYWAPSLGEWPPDGKGGSLFSSPRVQRALENWRRTMAEPPADRNRELLWRAFHGIFGSEYYDARWSALYRSLDHAVRLAAPFLILAALSISLSCAARGAERPLALCAGLLLCIVASQNLLFGSSPRLALPFLPAILLLGSAASADNNRKNFLYGGVLFALGFVLLAFGPHVKSWDWGKIERVGVTIEQWIPRRALPTSAPATLHVRIAAPVPGGPDLNVRAGDRILSLAEPVTAQIRPSLTLSLPQELLEENKTRPILLRLSSFGSYQKDSYLIFAVLPPPWRRGARRLDSESLSPGSDIASGALDWWAHPGSR